MKIEKPSFRKIDSLPPALETVVWHLVNDDLDQIAKWANLDSWTYPKGDLFQYIKVLNRFDTILESVCQEHELIDTIQRKPFENKTKKIVSAILNFSKLLLENCKNRNIYNSCEHLNNLLNTTDLDILQKALQLIMTETIRFSSSRSNQLHFKIQQEKIRKLIVGGSISNLISAHPSTISNKVKMSFYLDDQNSKEEREIIDVKIIPNAYTDHELFWKLVDDRMPKGYHLELLSRIRMANYASEKSVINQLLIVRFILIALTAHTMSETIAQNKVFIFTPSLVSQIAQFITYNNDVSMDVQTYALYALRGIAMHRTKIQEVLTVFNASANHGVLLHILRQLPHSNPHYTLEFLDAFFALLRFLVLNPIGGTMLMSAGIISTLVQVINHLDNGDPLHEKVMTKVIKLLIVIMNNINSAFSSFLSANGLDILLKIIQKQADRCIEQSLTLNAPLTIDSAGVIKEILRFMNHTREYENTGESLHNLIESSLPHTLKKIMENYKLFKPKACALAFTIMSTFIHNEPTSLTVLQEIGLPQIFLKTFQLYDECSVEVLMAAAHTFGAICLNSAGLNMLVETDTLPHFFLLLASKNFINTIHDMGSIELLGLAMDELIRHQPSLKIKVFECTNQLLLYATTLGHSEEGKPSDNSHQLTYEKSSQKEDVECFLMDYIHLVSEFLGGFFKNPENIKEFVKYKGPELLLQYYAFPMLPYNFFISNGFHKLNQLFQTVAGSSPVLIAKLIIQRLYETSRFLFTDLDVKKSVIYECIEANGKDNEISNQANVLFCKFKSLFGYVGLLSSVMTPSSISKGNKHAPKLLEWFLESYEDYDSIIQLVGEIHRILMWQNILLRESAPKSWYSSKLTQSSPEEIDDLKDPQAINMTRFKTIISEVSPALLPVLLSVIKISTSRKTTNSKQLLNMRCKRVAHKIAKLFNSHLNYLDCPDMPDCKYSYYASIFSMASMVLLGHNSQGILQTHIAIAFEGLGTVDLLINTFLPKFWKVLELQLETDQQDERLIQRINTCIETTLSILQQLGSPRLIFESPNTSILTDDDLDERSNTKPFNPEYWLAVIHLKLSGLYIYLQSPVLLKVSGRVLNSILGCVKQGLMYDRPRIDTNTNRRALILMGFSPELVDQALDKFEYAICALDYLFSRRLTSHRVESGPPQLGPLEQIDSTHPLTSSEFAAGLRILVNMWYDPILARRALMMFNNLAEAEKMLAKQGDSAIRVPWQDTQTQVTTTELIVHEENDIDNNDDDQYEDIDSDESLAEDESNDTLCWKEISQYAEKFSVYSVSNEYIKLIHQLDEIHQLIRANTPVIFASLTDKRDDLDIEIRDIMAALCCGNVSDKVKSMEQVMHLFFNDVDMDRSTRSLVDTPINRIRIFALMLREPIIKDVIAQLVMNISKFIDWSAFLDLVASYSTFPNSKWVTILSLILEIFLALSDEPADILPRANKAIGNQEVSLTDIPRPMPITALLDQKEALLKNCVQLLKMDHLPEDNLVAVLRIIVRLTKHHDLATSFVQMDGLETLLARPGTEFTLFKLQRDYIILILRHILESPPIMMESMAECIKSACHNRNGQIHSIFISDILKDNYSLLYRDPTLFLETSSLLLRLTSRMDSVYLYDGIDNNKLEGNDAKYKYKDFLTNMNDNSSSDFVINFLLKKISDTLENDIEQNDIAMAYVGLLLQSVLELILSYPSCKSNIIRFDISINIDDSADTILDAVLRKSILYKLITRLLPYNLLTDEASDLERKKQSISMWIISIIVGLCYNAKKYDRYVFNDKDTQVKIQRRIRDFVVRIIALSFSDMLRSNENIIRKYLHYYVLAGLCDHILYARVKPMTPSLNIMQEDVTDIAVLMLNKNYISLLISAMDDVNVDFPHAKTILTSILRPLEQLTKINIRTERHLIERARIDSETPVSFESTSVVRRDHERNEEEQGEEEEQDMLIPMDINEDDDASEEEEEVNNLYRNSSLAMFDGVVQDEESDEENYNDDIEMASSGEEVIETSSDDQYDTESDTDMESDERNEVEEEDEDQEMEDLIRSHRYHHSDTEEEEEEEREHDDDEDNSGSSDESSMHSSEFYDSHSYSSSDESLDSDRSGSYYSEADQVTWPLDDTNEEFASPNNNHRHEGVLEVDISSDNNSYTTNDEEDENSSSFYDEIELNPEELQNVEDNLRLFFNEPSSNPSRAPFVNSNANATRNFRSYDNDRIGRPLVRNDAILHPLFKSANALTAATGYRALNNTADHLQAYEDIIGHNAARILENMFLTIQREENASPSGQTENSTDSTSATSTEGKTEKESQLTLSILKDFAPMTTVKRWTQEAQMIYPPSVAVERAVNMRSLLSDALSMDIKKEEEDIGDENEVEQSNGFTIEIEADRDTINDLFDANMDAAIVFEEENPDEDEEPTSYDLRGNADLHQAQPLPSYPSPPRSGLEFSLPVEFGPQGNTHGTFPPAIIEDATGSIEAVARSPGTPADISVHHDAPRIVDLFELMSLVRLLFAPQSVSKTPLNRLLLNLCKNSKTRRDLLSLLIYILQMGTSNMESVDRSFKKLFPHQKGKKGNKSTNPVNSPSLITQRCLEILYYIVTWNGRSMSYFFVKRDIVAHLKSFHSTGPHKTKNDARYPILDLINLLDQPEFLKNANLVEQLMNLIATISRSLPALIKRFEMEAENKNNEAGSNRSYVFIPPSIPNQYVEKIADVLSMGECSSFTFQYTISILSHFSVLDSAFSLIIDRLISKAKDCGKQICVDLKQFIDILNNTKEGAELEGPAVTHFSATTSYQARFLRVLKAVGYLCTRKQNKRFSQDIQGQDTIFETYNKLDFLSLWEMTSSCLAVIQERKDLMNAASILLPLVESYMSVSKFTASKEYNAKAQATSLTDNFFEAFTEKHKKILNLMVRNNPSLMNGSFSILVHNPKILEFDNKRNYFIQKLRKRDKSRDFTPALRLVVRREHVFQDTYEQFHRHSGEYIRNSKIVVQFVNERGLDAGGLSREWFSILARHMFDPNYALFVTSAADRLTYQPNLASGVNAEHLNYFKFVGRLIGKAIYDGRLLDAYFTRSFYKLILGRSVDYRDVEAVDPAYYKSLVWMLENDITDIIDATFCVEVDEFGKRKIIDLKPEGRNISVTEENKHEYVALITEQKLVLAIKEQVNAFLEGFHDIIPSELIQIFNEQELELLISGLPDIDIDDWKANTVYVGYTISSPQIHWFWRAVRSFTQEERAKLLQFATGTSKVPLEGFSLLQGSNGVEKFQIHKEFGDVNRLPSAHTCFNQIDLPQYLTYEDLRSNLFKAISECSTGFAFQ